jgi:hypothetical protein
MILYIKQYFKGGTMKKFITTLLVAAAALAVTLIAAPMTANAEAEMAVVYAQIPDSWEAPHVWAWNNDGDHAFSNWPGGAMQEDPNNPGWYFVHIPASMEWVIISADVGDDREQTGDLIIDGLPVWITITGTEAGEVTWTHDQETDGDLPVYVAMAVVFAQIPAEWDAPHVWSWNNDGGHAFNDWPGGAMQEDPNNPGWFYVHIPETMEWVIISADVGDDRDQTGDLIIGGLPVWITITGTEAGEVTWTHDKQTEGDLPPSPGTPPPLLQLISLIVIPSTSTHKSLPDGLIPESGLGMKVMVMVMFSLVGRARNFLPPVVIGLSWNCRIGLTILS